jgi:hypothetical protein
MKSGEVLVVEVLVVLDVPVHKHDEGKNSVGYYRWTTMEIGPADQLIGRSGWSVRYSGRDV